MSEEILVKFPVFDWIGSDFRVDHCETVEVDETEIPENLQEVPVK